MFKTYLAVLSYLLIGSSGAAAHDDSGKFAGLALLKLVAVATSGPSNASSGAQAVLVPSDVVREFLKTNKIEADGASTDARAAVVRVICVRN